MKNRGFTLIEILVVLVIISILVSMATINTSQDPRKDLLHAQAEQLKFKLEAMSDEAIFNNKQMGFVFTRTELAPFSIEVNPETAVNANPYMWKPYESRFSKKIKLEQDMEFELSINSSPVQLAYAIQDTKELIPQIEFQASGEQTEFSLFVKIENYQPFVEIYGNGIGRFYMRNHNEE